MRAVVFSVMAVVSLLSFQAQPGRAESASSDKPGTTQPLTGSGGKEPPPASAAKETSSKKQDPTTKTEPPPRIGTLSPEEKRRAVRARERAAKRSAPAGAAETKTESKETKAAPSPAREAQQPAPGAKGTPRPTQAAATRPSAREVRGKDDKRSRRTASTTNRRVDRTNRPQRPRFAGQEPGPRIGYVVPRGVPLYPLPPRYRVGKDYADGAYYEPRPPWRYVPPRPGYPPFPRVPLYPRFSGADDDEE